MWEFLKRAYEEVYDLPNFYLGFEEEWYCHVFSVLFLLAMFLSIAYVFQIMFRGSKKRRIEERKRKRSIERMILGVLEEKDKNKKVKNY